MHALKTLWNAALGGALGLPAGFLVYLVARVLVLPTSTWSSDTVMWAVIAPVMALGALAGAARGRSSPAAQRFVRAAGFFLAGFVAAAMLAVIAGLLVAGLFGISRMEGAFDVGLMIGVAPLAGLAGGVAAAIWGALAKPAEPA
jgi:hypothetical protein